MHPVLRLMHCVLHTWESVQVELQGRYSVRRLQELVWHTKVTSLPLAVATTLFTPMPCILLVILTDIPRLSPPEAGIFGQTLAYWSRVFLSALIISLASVNQLNHTSASLYISPLRLWLLSIFLAVAMAVISLGYDVTIGFPMPFAIQLLTPWWQVLLTLSLWTLWKHQLREDEDARLGLQRYAWHFASVTSMAIVYPLLRYVFSIADANGQLVITALLPLIKLGFRNWSSYGVYRMEDVAPIVLTFSVDVFHSLFLACVMQGSNSSRTLVVTMVVDFCQGCVGVFEVVNVLQQATQVAQQIRVMEAKSNNGTPAATPPTVSAVNVIREAVRIVAAAPHLLKCPSIGCARHLRPVGMRALSTRYIQQHPSRVVVGAPAAYVAPSREPTAPSGLSQLDRLRVTYVRHVLTLLHMVEFYMLIEFTEVMVVLIYAAYLAAMSRLPNRVYYEQLKSMTDDQLAETLSKVLTYAAFELLSFLLLALVLSRVLRLSAFRVLAFALQKHWLMVQSQLILWVYYVIQLSLAHFGNDYTFQFTWLRQSR